MTWNSIPSYHTLIWDGLLDGAKGHLVIAQDLQMSISVFLRVVSGSVQNCFRIQRALSEN